MYLIPLNQMESVELVINALRIAGGEADCSTCPASKVCGRQCLAIAEAVARMFRNGTLPSVDSPSAPLSPEPKGTGNDGGKGSKGKLKVIK